VTAANQFGSALHVVNGSEACLVWFAGLSEPFLNPDFLRSRPSQPLDGLFLLDAGLDWYTSGFKGIGEDFARSVAWLREFLSKHGYKRAFLGGQSSGGYAALRIGRHISPTAVIAFSPQTKNIVNAHGQQQPAILLEDLSVIYADWDCSFPIYIHLSRSEKDHLDQFSWNDWEQIRPFLSMDNVTIIRHPFDKHAVSLPLYGRGLFYKNILSAVMLHTPDPRQDDDPDRRPSAAV
jgi:hypothetical protein